MMLPFAEADLRAFGLSIAQSPYRWGRCECGHPVDLAGISADVIKQQFTGGWYARVDCSAGRCEKCGVAGSCRSWIRVDIPNEPAWQLWAGYPRPAAQWRADAVLLPRTDGVYVCTLESRKELFKPRVYRDRCLLFTTDGDVLDLELTHDGYDTELFQGLFGSFPSRLRAGDLRFSPDPDFWRGLYAVTGTTLTCSLTEVLGERYSYTGTLSGDVSTVKLAKANAGGRKLGKGDYRFRPVAALVQHQPGPAPGPAAAAPAPGPAPVAPMPATVAADPAPPAYAFRAPPEYADRSNDLWSMAKLIGWTERPDKDDLKSLATTLHPEEAPVAVVRVRFPGGASQICAIVVTTGHLFFGVGQYHANREGWATMVRVMPPEYLIAKDRVQIPLADIEWIDSGKGILVLMLRGRRIVIPVGGDADPLRETLVRGLTQARSDDNPR